MNVCGSELDIERYFPRKMPFHNVVASLECKQLTKSKSHSACNHGTIVWRTEALAAMQK
jgi:hypothetical protein